MDILILCYLFFIIMCGFTIQTVSGFGSAVFAMPLALFVVNKADILPTFYILSFLQSAVIVYTDHRYIKKKLFLKMFSLAILGIPLAMLMQHFMDVNHLELLIGLYILLNSLTSIFFLYAANKKPLQNAALNSVLNLILPILSGTFQTLFGIGGPFIAMYMNRQDVDKLEYRANICLYWMILNPLLIARMFLSKEILFSHMQTTLYLVPAMYLGIFIGKRIINKISLKQFKLITNLLLVFISISIIL